MKRSSGAKKNRAVCRQELRKPVKTSPWRESRGNASVVRESSDPFGISSRRTLRVLDLFCGAGGLSEGFRLAGFTIVGGVDVDPDAIATHILNFPEAAAVCGDIRKPGVRERTLEMARRADMVVGGPPCQAFSQVRNHSRLIDDSRNSLYREFVRVIAETKPQAFVMENVTGMEQMGVREQIAEDLSLSGEYAVRSQVVDAADFGVPQTRKRLT